MAHAYINVTFDQLGDGGYWLMLIPNAAKPSIAQRVVGIHSQTHKPYMFNVRTDGKIENSEAIAQGNYYFDISWII